MGQLSGLQYLTQVTTPNFSTKTGLSLDPPVKKVPILMEFLTLLGEGGREEGGRDGFRYLPAGFLLDVTRGLKRRKFH